MIDKAKISRDIDEIDGALREVASFLHSNPETGGQEFEAVKILTEFLSTASFEIQKGVAGLPTAFVASSGDMEARPHLVFLAEYDALPEIGHACGHNLIAVAAMAAAVALSKQSPAGRVSVFGTPAEETDGGKIKMLDAGLFSGVDVAMMIHPGDCFMTHFPSLALNAFRFTFKGKSAHAAGSPQEGLNALDAIVLMFNGIGLLRQQLPDLTRVHGIIAEGGIAPNIIPDRTVAEIYVRSQSAVMLKEVSERVKKCATGAAEMTGTRVVIEDFESPNDAMINNSILEQLFADNLGQLGIDVIKPPGKPTGSSDLGNVSQRVPAIQPFVAICEAGVAAHTRDFATAAASPAGFAAAMLGAKALAMSGADLFNHPEKFEAAKLDLQRFLSLV
jgi:amidohydrolase